MAFALDGDGVVFALDGGGEGKVGPGVRLLLGNRPDVQSRERCTGPLLILVLSARRDLLG